MNMSTASEEGRSDLDMVVFESSLRVKIGPVEYVGIWCNADETAEDLFDIFATEEVANKGERNGHRPADHGRDRDAV